MNFKVLITNFLKVLENKKEEKTFAKTRFTGNRQLFPISDNRIRHLSSSKRPGMELPKGFDFTPSKNAPFLIEERGKLVFATTFDTSNLIDVISDPDVLLLAYKLITYSPDEKIVEVPQDTCDEVATKWIHEISQEMRVEQYKFGLAREATISKASKKVLITPFLREKTVLKAMALVFHEVFEPQFLNSSHGFRSGRGHHSALQMVEQTFRGGKWVIKADLTNCLDKISDKKLMSVLSQHIQCSKTLTLVSLGLKSRHIFLSTIVQDGGIGALKESILSSLLCNIYLHILDQFMHTLVEQNNMGTRRRANPEYYKLKYARQKLHEYPEQQRLIRLQQLKMPSRDQMDPNFRRLAYVRYSDDFLICVIGPRKLAVDLLGQVEEFLDKQLDLKINRKTTHVVKFSEGIKFLGCVISNPKIDKKPLKLVQSSRSLPYVTRISPGLYFYIPILQLFKRLVKLGYFKWSEQYAVPTPMGSLVNLDHSIILHSYNKVIRGLNDYYSFADNRDCLDTIIHGLKMSCAFTLALKYEVCSVGIIFRTFGSLLCCPKSRVHIYLPITLARNIVYINKYKRKFKMSSTIGMPKELAEVLTLVV